MDVSMHLREKKEAYNRELAVKQAVIEIKKDNLTKAKEALALCISDRDRVKEEEQSVNAIIRTKEGQITSAKNDIDEQTRLITSLQEELSGVFVFSFGRKKGLKEKIAAAESELSQKKSKLDQLNSEHSGLVRELKAGLLESLENRVDAQEKSVISLEKEVSDLKSEIAQINTSITEVDAEIQRQIAEEKKAEDTDGLGDTTNQYATNISEYVNTSEDAEEGTRENTDTDIVQIGEESHDGEIVSISLYEAILKLNSGDECWNFFGELIGLKEYHKLEQRVQLAKLLDRNATYNEVNRKTGASTATISRVNQALQQDDEFHIAIIENRENLDRSPREYFTRLIQNIRTEKECNHFFGCLCNAAERQAMELRFDIAVKLFHGKTYTQVSMETGASSATVARMKSILNNEYSLIKEVILRLEKNSGSEEKMSDAETHIERPDVSSVELPNHASIKAGPTILYYQLTSVDAVGYEDVSLGFVLKKGSRVCMEERVSCSMVTKRLRKKYASTISDAGFLQKDIILKSVHEATNFCAFGTAPGLVLWKDQFGTTLRNLRKIAQNKSVKKDEEDRKVEACLEDIRHSEEVRKAEEASLAEEARKAEEVSHAEEARKTEKARLAEALKVEEVRLVEATCSVEENEEKISKANASNTLEITVDEIKEPLFFDSKQNIFEDVKKRKGHFSVYGAMLLLHSEDECCNFFCELIGEKEYKKLEQRVQVAQLLDQNLAYNVIHQKSGASSARICRMDDVLKLDDEFHMVIINNRKNKDRTPKEYFCGIITNLKSEAECVHFFTILCNQGERKALEVRFSAAILLYQGKTYAQVSAETKASSTTVHYIKDIIDSDHSLIMRIIQKHLVLDKTDASNDNIELKSGTLTVPEQSDPYKINLSLPAVNLLYEGKRSHVIPYEDQQFKVNDHSYTVTNITGTFEAGDVGQYSVEILSDHFRVLDEENQEVTGQFELNFSSAIVDVVPRSINIKSADAEKEYDGIPLICETYTVTGDGWAEGEGAKIKFLPYSLFIGTDKNCFDLYFNSGTKESNYNIQRQYGTLNVLDRVNPMPLVISLESREILYDGKNKHTLTYDMIICCIDDRTLYVDGLKGTCYGKDAGAYIPVIDREYRIFNEKGTDVTRQYKLVLENTNVIIQPRKLYISTGSASKEYDGASLSCSEIIIEGDGLAEGDTMEFETTASITTVGTCRNSFSVCYGVTTLFSNYQYEVEEGTLTVIPRIEKYRISLDGKSSEFNCDTELHSIDGFETLMYEIGGHTYKVEAIQSSVSASAPGTYNTLIQGTPIVRDSEGNDVTDQFEVSVKPGTLTIIEDNTVKDEEVFGPSGNGSENVKSIDHSKQVADIIAQFEGRTHKDYRSRRELREEFTDTIEVHKHTALKSAEKFLNPVREVDPISKLKNKVTKRFSDVQLLCEIEIENREYDYLCFYLKTKIRSITRQNTHEVDILLTIALVQIGIRHYHNNFWPQVAREIEQEDINPRQRNAITETVAATLSKLGKAYHDERECVSNILMHSFIPDSRSSKFFDYLFTYYSVDLERDISELPDSDLDALCDDMINPYSARQQMLSNYIAMSVRAEREYCKTILRAALNMIDCSFWQLTYNKNQMLKGRLLERFEIWKNESTFFNEECKATCSRGETKERIRHFRSPHIIAKMGTNEFKFLLPSQLIPNSENLDEDMDIRWVVVSGEEREIACSFDVGCSGYRIREQYIEITGEDLFSETVFLLFADNSFLRSFTIDRSEIRFFDKDGYWVKSDQLNAGSIFAYGKYDSQVACSDSGLLISREIGGLQFYEFNLHEGELVSVQNEAVYYVGSVPETGLTAYSMIENLHVRIEDEEVVVFAAPPLFILDVEEGKVQGTAISVNGTISKMIECQFVDVRTGKTDERKYYFIDTKKLPGFQEGFNTISADIPNSNRMIQYRFYLLRDFLFSFENAPYVFQEKGVLRINRKKQGDVLLLDTPVADNRIPFTMDSLENEKLSFRSVLKGQECILIFDIPALFYSWNEEEWLYRQPDDIWHTDFNPVIYLKYPDSRVSMGVKESGLYNTVDGSLFEFRKRSTGVFACDMTKLKSYFSVTSSTSVKKVKETIILYTGDQAYEFINIIQRSCLADMTLKYDYASGLFNGTLLITGFGSYTVDLYCEDELIAEQVPVEDNRFTVTSDLETAEYTVKVFEEADSDDDFAFDAEVEFIGEQSVAMTNPDDLNGGCARIKSFAAGKKEYQFDENYKYYFFIEKQLEGYSYTGFLVALFRENIQYASAAFIQLDDVNELNYVRMCRCNNEKRENFYYNLKNQYLTELTQVDEKYTERFVSLAFEQTCWNTEFIAPISRILSEGKEWIEKENRKRKQLQERGDSIWKSEREDEEENLIGSLRTRYSPSSRRN